MSRSWLMEWKCLSIFYCVVKKVVSTKHGQKKFPTHYHKDCHNGLAKFCWKNIMVSEFANVCKFASFWGTQILPTYCQQLSHSPCWWWWCRRTYPYQSDNSMNTFLGNQMPFHPASGSEGRRKTRSSLWRSVRIMLFWCHLKEIAHIGNVHSVVSI